MKLNRLALLAIGGVMAAGLVQAGPITFESLTPQSTFLRADPTDTNVDVVGILLSSLDGAIVPGVSTITLSSQGQICFNTTCSVDTAPTFLGVFSSTGGALTAKSNLLRIPGVIAQPAGSTAQATGLTNGGLTTDISQDYLVVGGAGTTFVVPVGATTLYLGIADSIYSDNSASHASNTALGINVSFTDPSVPEPGTVGMMLSGLVGLMAFGRKRLSRN